MEKLEQDEQESPYDTQIKVDLIKAYRNANFITEANLTRERLIELSPISEQM